MYIYVFIFSISYIHILLCISMTMLCDMCSYLYLCSHSLDAPSPLVIVSPCCCFLFTQQSFGFQLISIFTVIIENYQTTQYDLKFKFVPKMLPPYQSTMYMMDGTILLNLSINLLSIQYVILCSLGYSFDINMHVFPPVSGSVKQGGR